MSPVPTGHASAMTVCRSSTRARPRSGLEQVCTCAGKARGSGEDHLQPLPGRRQRSRCGLAGDFASYAKMRGERRVATRTCGMRTRTWLRRHDRRDDEGAGRGRFLAGVRRPQDRLRVLRWLAVAHSFDVLAGRGREHAPRGAKDGCRSPQRCGSQAAVRPVQPAGGAAPGGRRGAADERRAAKFPDLAQRQWRSIRALQL